MTGKNPLTDGPDGEHGHDFVQHVILDGRITLEAKFNEHGQISRLTVQVNDDKGLSARDLRAFELPKIRQAYLAGRWSVDDALTDDEHNLRTLLGLPPYDGRSEAWRQEFADTYRFASGAFADPAKRIAEANDLPVSTVHLRIREARLRGDIPWSTK